MYILTGTPRRASPESARRQHTPQLMYMAAPAWGARAGGGIRGGGVCAARRQRAAAARSYCRSSARDGTWDFMLMYAHRAAGCTAAVPVCRVVTNAPARVTASLVAVAPGAVCAAMGKGGRARPQRRRATEY